MEYQRRSILMMVTFFIALIAIAGLGWFNIQYARQHPGGNDFIPRWLGTRLFLMKGQDPYSQQTTLAIQEMIFGRAARQGEDQSLFVYPFYSSLVFAPLAVISDFAVARGLWMLVLELAVVAITAISISLARWRLSPIGMAILFVFAILWYHSLRPVINGNAAIIVALFITLAFLAIRAKSDVIAGIFLALSTIKPQMVVLLILFILIWAISTQRWRLIISTLSSLAFMIIIGSFLIPNWVLENVWQLLAYPTYTLPGSPGAILAAWLPGVGSRVGWAITVLLLFLLLFEWWQALRKEFRWFYWTACLTLVLTNLIGVRTETANYIALLPGLILIFAVWDERWHLVGKILIILSGLLLSIGLWWLFVTTIQVADQPIQNPIMFFPVPIFVLIGLYWVRWWAIQPTRPLLDELRSVRSPGFE